MYRWDLIAGKFWTFMSWYKLATETERQRLRLDVGLAATDTTSLPDATIDAIYVEAGETYTDSGSLLVATRVITLRRLRAAAASAVDYTQNNSQEKASQRFAHLGELLAEWQGKLDEVVAETRASAARFGRTTRKPARLKEYPPTWGW